jgi:hypothetical protein
MQKTAKPEHRSGAMFLKIAVLGNASRLPRWNETKFGVINRPTEFSKFCELLLVGKADVGVVAPREQKELSNVIVSLLPQAENLRRSSVRVVVYAPAKYLGTPGLGEMRARGLVDFLPDSVSKEDLESFVSFAASPKPGSETRDIFDTRSLLTSLHSASGRLDIKKVADLFDLKVSELARQIGVEPKTALRTPDSLTVHKALLPYQEIANGFKVMGGDATEFRIWLNSPNSAIDGKAPHEVLAEGKANVLAGLVKGALLGQPA